MNVNYNDMQDRDVYETQFNTLKMAVGFLNQQREDMEQVLENWRSEPDETKGKKELKQYQIWRTTDSINALKNKINKIQKLKDAAGENRAINQDLIDQEA